MGDKLDDNRMYTASEVKAIVAIERAEATYMAMRDMIDQISEGTMRIANKINQ